MKPVNSLLRPAIAFWRAGPLSIAATSTRRFITGSRSGWVLTRRKAASRRLSSPRVPIMRADFATIHELRSIERQGRSRRIVDYHAVFAPLDQLDKVIGCGPDDTHALVEHLFDFLRSFRSASEAVTTRRLYFGLHTH